MNTRKYTRSTLAAAVAAFLALASTGAAAMGGPDKRDTVPTGERAAAGDQREQAAGNTELRLVDIGGRVGQHLLPVRER